MLNFSSLKTRIIILTAVPLGGLLAAILLGTIHTANSTVRAGVSKSLSDAGSVFIQLLSTRRDALMTMATVTARDPRFFATFSIPESDRGHEFGPTLEGVSRDFLRITSADFLEVFDASGKRLAHVNAGSRAHDASAVDGSRGLEEALRGYATTDYYANGQHLVVAAVVPVYVAQQLEAVVRIGSYLDNGFVSDVKRLTGADLSMVANGRELSSTFPEETEPAAVWAPAAAAAVTMSQGSVTKSDVFTTDRSGTEYLSIHVRVEGVTPGSGFDTYIARELKTELAPLVALEQRIAVAGLVALVVTLLAGFLLARSVTRPLSRVVSAAHAIKDGNYDHPLEISGRDEIADMGRIFDDMRHSLRKYVTRMRNVDQLKSNFIALAGHELRTPLTIISGFNELIASGAMGEIPDKVKETTTHIQQQLSDLNNQVQKILDMSSIEQGLLELHMDEVDLRSMAKGALESRRAVIADRQLVLRTELPEQPVFVRADHHRIEQAFLNLLDNAIRFTPDGGTITAALSHGEQNAVLSVKDTGVGIHPNEVEWVFRKMYDTDEVMHHTSGPYRFGSRGLGLGLALTKALVEKHGGKLLVKSTLGRGSEFTIVLDAARSEKPSPEPVPAA